jgi:ribonuclease VapC
MFIDASALCAIILEEDDGPAMAAKIEGAQKPVTSPLAVFETVLAVARAGPLPIRQANAIVAEMLRLARIEVVGLDAGIGAVAVDAFERFGKGRHPAKLNMGDCFAYASAATQGVPLLFKGDDFSLTDIEAA